MALTFFDAEGSEYNNVPFLNKSPYISSYEEGDLFVVREINETQRGGLLVITEEFKLHYYPESKMKRIIVEALEYYIANKGEGCIIYAVFDSHSNEKAKLAADFDLPCIWTASKGKYQANLKQGVGVSSSPSNPFIPPTAPQIQHTKGTGKARRKQEQD